MKKNLSGLSKPKLLVFLLLAALYHIADAQLLFNTSIQTPDANGYDYSIADMNNDSFNDIYISAHFGGLSAGHPGYIWMNNGNGSFTAKQTIGYPAVAHKVAFADLDADGDIDLFLANDASYADVTGADSKYFPGCPNEIWLNDGAGNFTNSGQLLGYEPSLAIKLADVDGDGDIDAVVGNYHPGGTLNDLKYKPDEVWLNDGKGFFTLSQKLGYGMSSPSLVDFDTDGDLDALVQDTLWLNDGHGKFAESNKVFQFGDNVNAIEFGDLNNDGHINAFIGNWNASAEVWLNDSSSNLINSGQKLGNLKCGNVQLIDIDSDGDLDAFTDNDGGPCKLWINQGGKQIGELGKFSDSDLTLPAGQGLLSDFNNDTKLDAIIGNKIWINKLFSCDYFGQTPPGDSVILFAPGIISLTDRFEGSIAFSPDGSECYFTVPKNINDEWSSKIYYTEYVNNTWTEQVETPFSKSLNPNFISGSFLSADGNRLYFTNEGDIWMIERTTEGWSEPQSLPAPINSAYSEESYSETSEGVVYFFSDRPGGFGEYGDIWCKHPSSDEVENLGAIVNSKSWQYSPCIAPDGSFLIFQRTRTSDSRFQDLYISFSKGNNEWTVPLNMEESGAGINIPLRAQINPSLSPDGKYLFFCRHDDEPTINDIYWVSTHIIDTLKKIALPTTLVNQAIDKKVMLYPNPTNGLITLSLGTSQNHEALVEIYNLEGAQVFSKPFKNTPSATIDLTSNTAGIYMVKVIADGVSYEEKIIKK